MLRSGRRTSVVTSNDNATSELTDDELFCLAARLEESGDSEKAFSYFQKLMRREKNPGAGRFAVGRLLLDAGDDSGVGLIEAVMGSLPHTIVPGCELIIRYFLAAGRESEARPYIVRYRNAQDQQH